MRSLLVYGALFFAGGALLPKAWSSTTRQGLCLQNQKIPSMGTFFEIQTVSLCHEKISSKQITEIQKELDLMESQMSLYQTNSLLSQLNRQGKLVFPEGKPSHLQEVLKASVEYYNKTEKTFDVSILPALTLIQKSFSSDKKAPSSEALEKVRPLIGLSKLRLSEKEVTFLAPGMAISLDGIAKGYAVDWVAEFLERKGFKDYLINFSGNMRWKGQGLSDSGAKRKWKLSVWNPLSQKALPVVLPDERAMASSGAENEAFDVEKIWHHIIDPRSLRPPSYWAQTTVVSSTALECDVLSTSTFVIDKNNLAEFLNKNFSQVRVFALDKLQKLTVFGLGNPSHQ